jgi:nucleotide-binding universal stress UspA family protein
VNYKTIIVHLNDERRIARLLPYARAIAEINDAHLIGLAVMPTFVGVPRPEIGMDVLIDEYRRAFRTEAEQLEREFTKLQLIKTLSVEWRLVDPAFQEAALTVAKEGQVADLIIVSQTDSNWSGSILRDTTDVLTIEASRPVLIVPNAGLISPSIERAVIAWNGSKESARAAFDALPLLKVTKKVVLLEISSYEQRQADADNDHSNGDDLCAALSRHGINCEVQLETPGDDGVGPLLLSALDRHSASLLVMGAYGHSRIREMIFGGATQYILENMTTPVFTSH